MARVSLVSEEDHPELSELMGRIRGARRGRLINVYRLLLHSPALAEAWFGLNNAVRWKTQLDGRLRELLIIRVGMLCHAPYILRQHIPKLASAEGLRPADWEALANWRDSSRFNERERVALAHADALTETAGATGDAVAGLKLFFDERQIVELTVLIGAYNLHARVLNGLDLDLESAED